MMDGKNSRKVRKSESPEEAPKAETPPAGRQGLKPKARKKNQEVGAGSEALPGVHYERDPSAGRAESVIKNNSTAESYRDDSSYSELNQSEIRNPKSEITMEVHHHPNVEKKNFKEYVLEGLMIFLAVTMGFFAETIREGISDRSKGHEYIKSFVQDLRADTARFSFLLAFDEKKISALGGQFDCFDSLAKNPRSSPCLVPLVKNSTSNIRVNFSDGTLQQLKNAGGFRLLNGDEKDSIVAYDIVARNFEDFESTVFQQQQDNIRNVYRDVSNYKANLMLFPDSGKNSDVRAPMLFSDDKAALNRYFNSLFTYRRVFKGHVTQIKKVKNRATGIIKYFEKKYDLKK